jgi:hypothetical protein
MNQIFILLFSFALLTSSAIAADVDIKWTEPDKYTDINAGENNRENFREQLFNDVEKHFIKLAIKLPEGQRLTIAVTNVDLAGTTLHAGFNRIRVIKEIYPPRMKFSYQLVDDVQGLVLAGKANLINMNFMMSRTLRYRSDSLRHEKRMLDKWFTQTFKSMVDN